MAAVSDYLKTNNLHIKPLSSYLAREVMFIARTTAPSHSFAGKIVSRGAFFVGGAIGIALSVIEALSAALIGVTGFTINYLFYEGRSEFWQKHSVRFFAYGLHSAQLAIALGMGISRKKIPTHTEVATFDLLVHLKSALGIQIGLTPILNEDAGRREVPLEETVRSLIQELPPASFVAIGRAIERDKIPCSRVQRIGRLQPYLTDHLESAAELLQLSLLNYISGSRYEVSTIQQIGSKMLRQVGIQIGKEEGYPDHLYKQIKGAFIEICQKERLWKLLDPKEGKERLKQLDPEVLQQLFMFAQYKELLEPIQCPLDKEMRYVQIVEAKEIVDDLSPEAKQELEKRLITTDGGEEGVIKEAFQRIRALSGDLAQGGLIRPGGYDLFQLAYEDAMEALKPDSTH